MTEEQEDILSGLMDMYGNWHITAKEYFKRALEYDIPYEMIEEYWEEGRWRVKRKKK